METLSPLKPSMATTTTADDAKATDVYLLVDVSAALTSRKFAKDLDAVVARAKESGVCLWAPFPPLTCVSRRRPETGGALDIRPLVARSAAIVSAVSGFAFTSGSSLTFISLSLSETLFCCAGIPIVSASLLSYPYLSLRRRQSSREPSLDAGLRARDL
jgi:hypothetical protein